MSHFEHDPGVISYAWELVEEYNKHQREQDRLHTGNHRPRTVKKNVMGLKTKERCKESKP
jgi:hypothetical protein